MPDGEARLRESGLEVPEPRPPIADHEATLRTGDLNFLAAHGPRRGGTYQYRGKVRREVDIPAGRGRPSSSS